MRMHLSGEINLEMKRHREDHKPVPSEIQVVEQNLRRYAAVCNNLGGLLIQRNETVAAMQILQESVQTLMSVEDPTNATLPSEERQKTVTKQLRQLLVSPSSSSFSTASSSSSPASFAVGTCSVDGIPGLFGMSSWMKGSERNMEDPMLVFSDPFMVDNLTVQEKNNKNGQVDNKNVKNNTNRNDQSSSGRDNILEEKGSGCSCIMVDENVSWDSGFVVSTDECSKASLFNMGLIHYKWKSFESAVQFFELSMSLAQSRTTPFQFDPVVLACLNNIGQIYLQRNKSNEAKSNFFDALTRANSSLTQLRAAVSASASARAGASASSSPSSGAGIAGSTDKEIALIPVVRRFIARTLMNMGWVQFFDCDYDASMSTCSHTIQLLSSTPPTQNRMGDVEAAAIWYNIALIHHHKNERIQAISYIDKFLDVAYTLLGIKHLQIAAALHRKSLILFEMGNLYESSKLLHIALRIRKAKLGNDHPLVAEHLVLLGKVYQEREEYCYATSALKSALRIQRSLSCQAPTPAETTTTTTTKTTTTATTTTATATTSTTPTGASQTTNNHHQQEESSQQHMSFDVAQTLIDLGRALLAQGRLNESLDAYLEVAQLTKAFFGERHVYVARILKIIGNIYLEQGNIPEAIRSFVEGMRIHVEQSVPSDFNLVQNPLSWAEYSHGRCAGFA